VGLSTPAVAERVRRMEDEGIIRAYRAEIDPARVGLPITAFIRMSIVGNVLAKLTECVHAMPEIVECNRGTGEDSFILKVSTVSIEHLKTSLTASPPSAPRLPRSYSNRSSRETCSPQGSSTGEPPANKTGAHPNAPGEPSALQAQVLKDMGCSANGSRPSRQE